MHRVMQAVLPGAYLVEIFPVMIHLPTWMAPWKKWGLDWYRKDTEMFQGFYDGVAKTMVSSKIRTRTRECSWKAISAKEISNPPSHLHSLNVRKHIDCRTMRLLGLLDPCCMTIFLSCHPNALIVIVLQWGWCRHSACRALLRFSKIWHAFWCRPPPPSQCLSLLWSCTPM